MKKKWRLILRHPENRRKNVSLTVWTRDDMVWFDVRQACVVLHKSNFVDLHPVKESNGSIHQPDS